MAKHTATPWVVEAVTVWDFEDADIVSINQQDGGSRIADIPNGGPSGDKRANAAHIVKCVNNHDALVAVLRDIVENYNLCTCPEGYDNVEIWNHEVACTHGDALKVLESAIAKAKGGTGQCQT